MGCWFMGFDGRDCLFGLCLDPHTPDDARAMTRPTSAKSEREAGRNLDCSFGEAMPRKGIIRVINSMETS